MRPRRIVGVDFSSAPRAGKPIVIARGVLDSNGSREILAIEAFERIESLSSFQAWLSSSGPWVGGFDFPFGLPRDFIRSQEWEALDWAGVIERVAALPRAELVQRCRDYADRHPAGAKLAHRETDRPAGSSPSMKWVNPPVVQMLQAGVPRLVAAGVSIPGLRHGDCARVALEAYPGLLARLAIGRRSYKSDDRRRDDAARREGRSAILRNIAYGANTGISVELGAGLRETCVDDAKADLLDAVLCAVQAAWGALRETSGWGLPERVDPLEGWIVGSRIK